MILLSKAQVLGLHEKLIERFGGSPGMRDEGLLDAALAAPFQSFAGEELYSIILAVASGSGTQDALLEWLLEHQI